MSIRIEQEKEVPDIKQEIKTSCRTIFQTSIDLLKIKGQTEKIGLLKRGQVIKHTINSNTPSFPIRIWSKGTDLEKTKKINVWIAGIGGLKINREILKGGDKFTGKFQRLNSQYEHDLTPEDIRDVRDFIKTLRITEKEIRYPQNPQSA